MQSITEQFYYSVNYSIIFSQLLIYYSVNHSTISLHYSTSFIINLIIENFSHSGNYRTVIIQSIIETNKLLSPSS